MNEEEYRLRLEGFICELVQCIRKTFAERGVEVLDGFELCGHLAEAEGCKHAEFNVVGDLCLEAEEILE